MVMLMSLCGWRQNAWLITLVSVWARVFSSPASPDSIWWRFLKTVDSRLPFGHDGTWADCALVINLVYWKASVREMMCVNCMSAPTLTPWEFLGLCIVRICVWIWFCQELSWQRLCKSEKNCINSYVLFPSPFPLSFHRQQRSLRLRFVV